MLVVTWANVVEHGADPHDYWGSRGRGFKSRRPDSVRVPAGHRLAAVVTASLLVNHRSGMLLLEPFTRGLVKLIFA